MLASNVFIKTDFPEPVVPATRRCGVLLKSITSILPEISLPTQRGILNDVFLKLSSLNNSFIVIVSLFSLGTSTPKYCVPKICAILTAPTPILLDISSARFIIVLIFIPAAGSISNNVTTGPCFTLTTWISILKSSNTFSNKSEYVLKFSLSFLFLNNELLVSNISSDGDR